MRLKINFIDPKFQDSHPFEIFRSKLALILD